MTVRVEVKFQADAEPIGKRGYDVKLPASCFGREGEPGFLYCSADYCTPILPDFRRGDVVEHENDGLVSQYSVRVWNLDGKILEHGCLTCVDAWGRRTTIRAADCRIVRKAGEGRSK